MNGGCTERRTPGPSADKSESYRVLAAPPVDLATRLEPIRDRYDVPALAAAVVRNDRLVALGAVGVRQRGSPEAVTVNDRFHLGSDTKAMTATMIAQLVEQGRLAWTATVGEAFPELRATMRPEYRDVTLEQLLQHRAGLSADLFKDGLLARLRAATGTPTEQRQMLVATVLSWPPVNVPGTTFLYSNSGYVIAGAMAERATGAAWEDLMCRMIFEPLGMTSAGFGAPGTPEVVDQPRGHELSWFRIRPLQPGPAADNPVALGPAGTVHCSLPDWAQFVRLHLRGEREETGLLRPETFVYLHTPPPGGDYALGWGVLQHPRDGRALRHAGSNTLWFAQAWLALERDYAVLVATNQGDERAQQATSEAVADLIEWVHGVADTAPVP